MYTADDIKTVLWNTYKETCGKIDIVNSEGPNYVYKVYPDIDSTLEEISNLSEELFETDLFDIEFKRDPENKEYLLVTFLNEEIVFEKKQFLFLLENSNTIEFTDDQIKNRVKRFDSLNIKYHNNNFFKSIMSTLKTKKKLSKKQNDELDYLLKHGKTMYENGYLTTKN